MCSSGGAALGLLLVLAAGTVDARVYQWRNPTSGSVELSGTPPAWYRGAVGGPRVLVYQNGQLIDDTAFSVEPALGEELREAAFREFERRQEREALKRLERTARRERARREEAERKAADIASLEMVPEETQSPVEAAVEEVPEILDPQVIDRLKSMLRVWDQQQLGQ